MLGIGVRHVLVSIQDRNTDGAAASKDPQMLRAVHTACLHSIDDHRPLGLPDRFEAMTIAIDDLHDVVAGVRVVVRALVMVVGRAQLGKNCP